MPLILSHVPMIRLSKKQPFCSPLQCNCKVTIIESEGQSPETPVWYQLHVNLLLYAYSRKSRCCWISDSHKAGRRAEYWSGGKLINLVPYSNFTLAKTCQTSLSQWLSILAEVISEVNNADLPYRSVIRIAKIIYVYKVLCKFYVLAGIYSNIFSG